PHHPHGHPRPGPPPRVPGPQGRPRLVAAGAGLMRIVWLCHYFAPEMGAPQARLLEMSREFLAHGHEVEAVTCFPNHPTGELRPEDRGATRRTDAMDGITVERCWSFVTP